MPLSFAARGASPTKIDANPGDSQDRAIIGFVSGPPLPQARANPHDPNEQTAKMGSSMRIHPLSLPPRPVLYNVIASMTPTHATGKPVI